MGPKGKVAMVFTDIAGFTQMFDMFPEAAKKASSLHDALIRQLIIDYDGYEVKTEGDAFMIAFQDIFNAALFCLDLQTELMATPFPAQLYSLPKFKTEFTNDSQVVFHGMRVRVGLTLGRVERITNKNNPKRSDYIGPSVNLAARISDFAYGGQTLIDEKTMQAIKQAMMQHPDSESLLSRMIMKPYATYHVKGIAKPQLTYSLLPNKLENRLKLFNPEMNQRGKGSFVPPTLELAMEAGGGSQGGDNSYIQNELESIDTTPKSNRSSTRTISPNPLISSNSFSSRIAPFNAPLQKSKSTLSMDSKQLDAESDDESL
mmetsp:Transcript_553/g.944  ORF Transcript_553/g.944 Transcript_553/m.944 type:complete len:317 (+) Transcript_553:1168-2118(+)